MANTLFDKIWEKHVVKNIEGGPSVLYIDKHFIHEVTSPQAFKGLKQQRLTCISSQTSGSYSRPQCTYLNQHLPIQEELSRIQVQTLKDNCEKFGIELYGLGHPFQGIVHIIGPELGITQPA